MSITPVLPDECALNIFSNLSPRDILAARAVCRAWDRIAQDGSLYVSFASEYAYFDRKDGEEYFADSPNAFFRFWAHYKVVQGRTLAQTTAVIPKGCVSLEDTPLPYANFVYQTHRVELVCFLHLGGGSDDENCGRVFALACLHGDGDMLDTIAQKRIQLKDWMFQLAFLFADRGGHRHFFKKIEDMGGDLDTKLCGPLTVRSFLASS